LEYDVGYAFAAKCFPEGSAVDGVESRLNVQECNVQWPVKFTFFTFFTFTAYKPFHL